MSWRISAYLSLISLIPVWLETDLKCGGAAMMINWQCLASRWQRGGVGIGGLSKGVVRLLEFLSNEMIP